MTKNKIFTFRPAGKNNIKVSTPRVLALAPGAVGLGYAVFSSPQNVLDWGVSRPLVNRLTQSVNHIEKLLKKYNPKVVTIEITQSKGKQGTFGKKLTHILAKRLAVGMIPFKRLQRQDIQALFKEFDATTKQQVADKIIDFLPMLERFRPEHRAVWEPEDRKMKIFDAISLGLTYYASLDDERNVMKAPVMQSR